MTAGVVCEIVASAVEREANGIVLGDSTVTVRDDQRDALVVAGVEADFLPELHRHHEPTRFRLIEDAAAHTARLDANAHVDDDTLRPWNRDGRADELVPNL